MTQRHKHADVLIAIAEGKEVEYYCKTFQTWQTPTSLNPILDDDLRWRVKPEPEAEWKQKLRQAAREGKQILHKGGMSQLMWNADTYKFEDRLESDYRIVPKTVTRWLWAYRNEDGYWQQDNDYMTVCEAEVVYESRKRIRLEYTRTEFPE